MTQDSLIGTWRLISWEFRDAEGYVSYPMGRDASGYLTYTPDGYMWATVMNPHRPAFASQDMRKGTTEEKVAAFDTYTSYFGTYEVRRDTIIHHVRSCLYPNWVGGDQERFVTWEGTRLRLSTSPMLIDGASRTAHLLW
jgi:lipocalin-like protein